MAGSLRVNLLRLLIPPVAVILAVGSIGAYYLSIDPAADAWQKGQVVQIIEPTGIEHASGHGAKSGVRPPSSPTGTSGPAAPTK